MNEETTLPTEVAADPVPELVTEPVQTEDTILDLEVESTGETIAMELETVTLVDFQQGVSDICHVSLFGSFLLCGTLIGLALFWRIYGT